MLSAMPQPVIVVHYHELWLKGRNRNFFLNKLGLALKRSLEGIPFSRVGRPGDRMIIVLKPGPGKEQAAVQDALARIARVVGVANYSVARTVERSPEASLENICEATWLETAGQRFSTFAVRAKRSDKSFPVNAMNVESEVGRYLLEKLRAAGREVRVNLNDPDFTCHIEITPGPVLVYSQKIPGPGGLPANSGGRMMCLLSGGFDSAVAAYKMIKRGAHLSFVHFWGGGAREGESSVHVARELARKLVPYQFTAKLYLVPFEPLQREIVRLAPETYRVLLYRRLMLRIASKLAERDRIPALVTGDSLGQVASQTLQNMVAVGDAVRMPVFRPLAGEDKLEIQALARKIGTYEISAEPFHDCCPVFMPRVPALFATPEELTRAEEALDIEELVRRGLATVTTERFRWSAGQVESVAPARAALA